MSNGSKSYIRTGSDPLDGSKVTVLVTKAEGATFVETLTGEYRTKTQFDAEAEAAGKAGSEDTRVYNFFTLDDATCSWVADHLKGREQ